LNVTGVAPAFSKAMVRDIIQNPTGPINKYNPVPRGFSLLHAWEILSRGTHRVPVVDDKNIIWDIITQSMLVDFLWQNIEKIGNLAVRRVGTLFANIPRIVQTVSEHSTGILAFRLMLTKRVYGLAVVDEVGNLVDNISDRDIRVIYPNLHLSDFSILWQKTVREIKDILRARSGRTPPALLYVTPDDTFSSLIEKMAVHHVHRLFMVESTTSMIPTRCILQTDVLMTVITNII